MDIFPELPKEDNRVKFDKSINLGNLITLITLVFTLLNMYAGIIKRMDNMEFKVDAMWSQFTTTIRK